MKYAFCIVASDFKWSLLTLFQFESDNAKEVCDDNTFCKHNSLVISFNPNRPSECI